MKPTKLITWLFEQYQTINEKVPYINEGGCGIFAEKLFNLLTSLSLNPKLIVLTNNRIGMDKRIGGMEGYSRLYGYASITHIVVKLNDKYIDSTGIYETIKAISHVHKYKPNETYTSLKLTIDKLMEWNAEPYMWNDNFNRKHIKRIENKLNECYKKYEKVLVVSN